jgi:hypothetical protein
VAAADVTYRTFPTWLGAAILVFEGLQELNRKHALENDPNKKRDILEQIPALIRVGSEQLFSALSKEENPHQLLLLVAKHNCVFEERRAQLKEPHTPEMNLSSQSRSRPQRRPYEP